jgi:hypothetical protein
MRTNLATRKAAFEVRFRARAVTVASCLLLLVLLAAQNARSGDTRYVLEYAPGPADNPLKGLVPYAKAGAHSFPHSMEFSYFSLSALVTGYDRYDWAPLERFLNEAAERGHQGVFRVYLEWPGRAGAIPAFLVNDGLKVYKFTDTSTEPSQNNETPEYHDPRLRSVLLRFIAAMGRKYDGDPRVGFRKGSVREIVMFSAGLFTPATDGSQGHVSPLHEVRLEELPLYRMAPSPPPDPVAKEKRPCASPSFVAYLGSSLFPVEGIRIRGHLTGPLSAQGLVMISPRSPGGHRLAEAGAQVIYSQTLREQNPVHRSF